jgi:hypothetical protein
MAGASTMKMSVLVQPPTMSALVLDLGDRRARIAPDEGVRRAGGQPDGSRDEVPDDGADEARHDDGGSDDRE